MSRTKITNVGALYQLADGGVLCSLTLSETQETVWVEALPNTRDWPYLMVPPLDRQRRIVIRQHQVKVCDI